MNIYVLLSFFTPAFTAFNERDFSGDKGTHLWPVSKEIIFTFISLALVKQMKRQFKNKENFLVLKLLP